MHGLVIDSDVRKLAEYVKLGNKLIEVFIEHERRTLHTYYMTHNLDFSIPEIVLQEVDDKVIPQKQGKKRKPVKIHVLRS